MIRAALRRGAWLAALVLAGPAIAAEARWLSDGDRDNQFDRQPRRLSWALRDGTGKEPNRAHD